jgi:signal transduction histidine kinase
MRERVRQLNGQFEIQSHGEGTLVTARLPIVEVPAPVATTLIREVDDSGISPHP